MEKILLVINAHQPDLQDIRFACTIAKDAGSKLTGVFIENVYFEYIPSSIETPNGVFTYTTNVIYQERKELITDTELCIRIFREQCEKYKVRHEVYQDKGEPIQEIIFESRFSDLLIMDPGLNFQDGDQNMPSHFTKELLMHAECPVLLTPGQFGEVKEIVCCYDGTASSAYAIKQFAYLFPFYKNVQVTILEVEHREEEESNEELRKLIELVRCHFSSVQSLHLKGEAGEELFKYFFKKTEIIIVMGAYGRGMLSSLFKKSKAELLIRMVNLPLFITHV